MLFSKFLAWIHSVPDGGDETRLETLGQAQPPEVEAEYIVELFTDLMQLSSEITQSDMYYWSEMSGIKLSPWEHSSISKMVSSFNHQKRISTAKDCPSPLLSEQEKLQQKMQAYKEKMLSHAKG